MTPLRDYQEKAIVDTRAQFQRGAQRVVLVMPTGAGKTRTGARIIRLAKERGRTPLWTAHRSELVTQAQEALEREGCGDVPVLTVQSLTRKDAARPPADFVFVDEAHHLAEAAEEWSKLLSSFYAEARVLGATATPERSDGTGLAPLFDALVEGPTVRELTEQGHLVPCEVVRPDRILKPNEIAQSALDAYRENAPGTQAISFHRSVRLAEQNAVAFTEAGFPARCIHAETPPLERLLFLEEYRQGKVKILTNVFILTEGTDLPMTETILLARGAGSDGMLLQMTGRGLRPHPNKSRMLLLDLTGITHARGLPQDDRRYALEGRALRSLDADGDAPMEAVERATAEEIIIHEKMLRYAKKRAEGPEERFASVVRWIRAGLLDGKKPEHVYFKYKYVYETPLSSVDFRKALSEISPEELSAGAERRAIRQAVMDKRAVEKAEKAKKDEECP